MRATRALHDADGHATLITVEPPRQRISTNDELRAGFGLTATEVRVAHALAEGCSNAVIAERLTISVHTVRRHVENVFRKLGVNARAAVAARLVTGGAE
jgi:DNA-binding NarL/FixJ family response regulator